MVGVFPLPAYLSQMASVGFKVSKKASMYVCFCKKKWCIAPTKWAKMFRIWIQENVNGQAIFVIQFIPSISNFSFAVQSCYGTLQFFRFVFTVKKPMKGIDIILNKKGCRSPLSGSIPFVDTGFNIRNIYNLMASTKKIKIRTQLIICQILPNRRVNFKELQ